MHNMPPIYNFELQRLKSIVDVMNKIDAEYRAPKLPSAAESIKSIYDALDMSYTATDTEAELLADLCNQERLDLLAWRIKDLIKYSKKSV